MRSPFTRKTSQSAGLCPAGLTSPAHLDRRDLTRVLRDRYPGERSANTYLEHVRMTALPTDLRTLPANNRRGVTSAARPLSSN
jgi:hypothetical protein